MPRRSWKSSNRRTRRKQSRRISRVQRSPITETVRAIEQFSSLSSFQRIDSSAMPVDPFKVSYSDRVQYSNFRGITAPRLAQCEDHLRDIAQPIFSKENFVADEEGGRAEGAALDRALRIGKQSR